MTPSSERSVHASPTPLSPLSGMAVVFAVLMGAWAPGTWARADAPAPQLAPAAADRWAGAAALLASPVRTDADRRADPDRKPLDLLRFTEVAPGMKVLDIASEGGYTAQLLALAVGPQGHVWAQDASPSAAFAARLAAHPQANLEPLRRPFADLYPASAPRVDLVTFVLAYHDIVNAPVDRAKMNRAIFDALRPGGHLVVIDHAARAGRGLQDTKSLHRIEEPTLRAEVEAAGFRLEAEADFLRNADDPREQPFFKMKMPTDRFALRFVKPR